MKHRLPKCSYHQTHVSQMSKIILGFSHLSSKYLLVPPSLLIRPVVFPSFPYSLHYINCWITAFDEIFMKSSPKILSLGQIQIGIYKWSRRSRRRGMSG